MSAIVPFRFREDTLDVVQDGEDVWVALHTACAALGLSPDAQRVKLKSKEWARTAMIAVGGEKGSPSRDIFCVHVEALPMWLATIDPARVASDVRPKLAVYQRECSRVLADHFLGVRGAPRLTAQEAAETFSQQSMRVADDPLVMARLRRAIMLAALSTKRSWASVEGLVRKTAGAPGWTRVALFNVPRVMALLESVADGIVLLPRKSTKLRLVASNPRQLGIPFEKH